MKRILFALVLALTFAIPFRALDLLNLAAPDKERTLTTTVVSPSAPQATIFTETMGVGSTSQNYSIGTYTGWSNPTLTFSGNGDVRATSPSTGYAGASGNANVFLTANINAYFEIAGINTLAYDPSTLSLTFGGFKNTNNSNGSELIVQVSTNGTTYTNLTLAAFPTGTGTATWGLRTVSGSIPATSNLRIKFINTAPSGGTQFRLDDVTLTGALPVQPGTLQFGSATYSVNENGGSIGLTVTRTGGSGGSVGAQITETDGTAIGGTSLCTVETDDYTKATYAVSFADGETSKTVSIPVCSDGIDESDETFTAKLGSVTGGATLGTQASATVTIVDDDTAGVTVTETGGSTDVAEAGGTDTYTVVLNSQPSSVVTITVTPDSQVMRNRTTLSFGFFDWNIPQTVTVSAVDDSVYEGPHTGTIAHTVSSSDPVYNGMSVASVTVNITDNDAPPTLTVTKTADTNDGICNADCSLREAIGAAVSGSTITFSSLFNSAQTITTGSELLIDTKNLNIVGPGANLLTLDGGPLFHRIFTIGNSTVTISGMSMTGGNGTGSIGGSGVGGAVYGQSGAVTLDGVHIYGNAVNSLGGGVYFDGGTHTIKNSTLSSNTAGSACGGALADNGAAVSIKNTTVSANSAGGAAGGLCVFSGTINITNSTITGNSSNEAGGVFTLGDITLGSTIVAGNTGAQFQEIGFTSGSITSLGFNLIGDNAGDAINTRNPVTYQPTDIQDTDPMFLPLDNYGGTTPVVALGVSPTSPAIDKGFNFMVGGTADQRGMSRTIDHAGVTNANGGDGTDIGAYESLIPTAAPTSVSGRVRTADGRGIANATVTIEGGGLAAPVTVVTSSFGMFRFEDIPAGQTYIVTVRARRFAFDSPSRAVSVRDELAGVDFVAR